MFKMTIEIMSRWISYRYNIGGWDFDWF